MGERARIGFIGLGQMGLPMARNLLKAGFSLTVHNRSRGKVDQLVAEGADAATTPRELAAAVDVVFSCVPGPADVLDVYLGEGGAVAGAAAGTVLCDMSTIDPETHRQIHAAAAKLGVSYLDAPVSGGTSGAREGTLSIMVGGETEPFERMRPALEAMGKNIYHVGPIGAGATVKLINQMMGAICHMSVIEGLVLGTKAGIEPRLLVDILSSSSGASQALRGAAPNVLARTFEPGFTIDLMQKDVSLAVAMARALRVRALAGSLAEQIVGEARAAGLGGRANHALVQPLERLTGVEVRA